jgi:hypothetical protein
MEKGITHKKPVNYSRDADMSNKIDDYIESQPSPQKEVFRELRALIQRTFPDTDEEIKWGVPAFAQGLFYIVALKDHVNLGFSIKGLSKDEIALFDGGGKTMKHIEIRDIDDIDEKRIERLMRMVYSKSSS